jgi:hypothetical protein
MFGTLSTHPLSPQMFPSYYNQMPSLNDFDLGSASQFFDSTSNYFPTTTKRPSDENFNRPAKKSRGSSSLKFNNENTKIPASNVPLSSVEDQDVLSGRGGATNIHPGNRYFRELINENRLTYLNAKKNDKPDISRAIVNKVRQRNGRFLKKCDETSQWFEIGDNLAREKTSQALRQRAPQIRKMLRASEERCQLGSKARYTPTPVVDTMSFPQENIFLQRKQLLLQMLLQNQGLSRSRVHDNGAHV